ncbi:hypothetical protein [Sinomonas halotolerans]|uniref:MFS transporter n=1 Tax=Sinomonas halotolerans TaxID=1644133 RepID=A0ABU9X061_9MICC
MHTARETPSVPVPPSLRGGNAVRWMRTTAMAGTVTALAAGAHAWAGGSLPHPTVLAALLALVALGSTLLGRVTLRLPALIGVLGAGQLALHEAFTLLSMPAAVPAEAANALAFGRHQHVGDAVSALASSHPAAGAAAPEHAHASWAMVALHAVATLACAAVIRQSELALTALAEWIRPLLHLPQPPAVVPAPAPAAAPPYPVQRALAWRTLAPPPLRGPPPATAFA